MIFREYFELFGTFYEDGMKPLISEKIPFLGRYFQRIELDKFALRIIKAKANKDVMKTIGWLK